MWHNVAVMLCSLHKILPETVDTTRFIGQKLWILTGQSCPVYDRNNRNRKCPLEKVVMNVHKTFSSLTAFGGHRSLFFCTQTICGHIMNDIIPTKSRIIQHIDHYSWWKVLAHEHEQVSRWSMKKFKIFWPWV